MSAEYGRMIMEVYVYICFSKTSMFNVSIEGSNFQMI